MKAKVLKSVEKQGSSVAILELGGIQLKAGEEVLVDARIAERVAKVYPGKIEVGGDVDVPKLKSGHYEVKGKSSESAPAPKKKVKKEKKEEPKVEEKKADSLEEKAKDKSMGSFLGRKKTRKKKAE